MKVVKRAIILCWVMLIVCLIIKLFGGNWFGIICYNKHFIYICEIIDKSVITQDIFAFIVYIPSSIFSMLAITNCPKPNVKQFFVVLSAVCLIWFSQYIARIVKLIIEPIIFSVLPFIVKCVETNFCDIKENIKQTWYRGFLGYLLILVFQIISLVTRGMVIKLIPDNTLIATILAVDYYIMIVLYYLYVKLKKEEKAK